MKNVLIDMPSRHQDVILRRLGIKNGQPETLEEIGKVYGLTRERVRQLEALALVHIRENMLNADYKVEFMIAYQSSHNIGAVATKLGIPYSKVIYLSNVLRGHGFHLKRFPKGSHLPPKVLTPEQRASVDPKFKARLERDRKIIDAWNTGRPPKDIAAELGFASKAVLAAYISRLRGDGHHLLLRRKMSPKKVSNDNFVRVWNSSNSIKEACEKLQGSYQTIYHRANKMRSLGIPLKKFESTREYYTPLMIERLKKIATEALSA